MSLKDQIYKEDKIAKIAAESFIELNLSINDLSEKSIKLVLTKISEIMNRAELLKSCKLSFRTITIAYLEDKFWENKNYIRSDYPYENIVKGVLRKYNKQISTRNQNNFKDTNDVHPEKPCEYYEIFNHTKKEASSLSGRKKHYREALEKVETFKDIYLEYDQAKESVTKVFSNVKNC